VFEFKPPITYVSTPGPVWSLPRNFDPEIPDNAPRKMLMLLFVERLLMVPDAPASNAPLASPHVLTPWSNRSVPLLVIARVPVKPEQSPCSVNMMLLLVRLSVSGPEPLSAPLKVLVPLKGVRVLALTTLMGVLEEITEVWLNDSVLPPSVMGPVPSMFVSVIVARLLKNAIELLVGALPTQSA